MSDEPTRKRAMPPRKWGDEPAPSHPAPEVAMRDATEAEIGRSARVMRKLAQAHGWAVRVTYARGTVLHLTGKPGKVVDSIAVRFHMVNRFAWGVWHDGGYDSGQVWDRETGGCAKNVGAKELKAFLSVVTP